MIDTIYIHQPKDPYDDPYLHDYKEEHKCPECGGDDINVYSKGFDRYGLCEDCEFESYIDKFITNNR